MPLSRAARIPAAHAPLPDRPRSGASPRRLLHSLLLVVVVLLAWSAALFGLGRAAGVIQAGNRDDVTLWIMRKLPRPWLDPPARLLGGGYRPATDAQLSQFFSLTSALAAAETDVSYLQATGQTDAAAESRVQDRLRALNALRAPVEARLAAELSVIVRQEGLTARTPLLRGPAFVWPPVSFAYTLPPHLLILSRRDRIETVSTTLLRNDLTDAQIQQIEAAGERQGYSALVVRVGGVATYPSIVEEDDTYANTLDLIAHEWTHQYLFFHPLGVRYFASPSLTTINETVANMSGQELAAAIRARFPLPVQPRTSYSSAPPPDHALDFDRTLHSLRVEVDRLLAQGRVAEAEARMNATQRLLAQHGYYIRKINQAYFAFYGTYANTAASTNPLGPELANLRARYATLGAFLHAVQNVTSVADLNRLLNAPHADAANGHA